jgi:hypothetical protein
MEKMLVKSTLQATDPAHAKEVRLPVHRSHPNGTPSTKVKPATCSCSGMVQCFNMTAPSLRDRHL